MASPVESSRPPGARRSHHERRSELYVPILRALAHALGFAVLLGRGGHATGRDGSTALKLAAYECGIEPTPQPSGGGRFPVKYYMTAMLFIIFDIEMIFLYPWAVPFDRLGTSACGDGAFIARRVVAYAYVWRRGGWSGTDWVSRRSSQRILLSPRREAAATAQGSLWPATFGLACWRDRDDGDRRRPLRPRALRHGGLPGLARARPT
jgi:NADH-quinone oxidoreductase subunit A